QQLIDDPQTREAIVKDSVLVLDQEVSSKKGVSGLVVKGGFKVIKSLEKGRIIERLINWLLDDFVAELEPFYAQYQQIDASARPPLSQFLIDRTDAVTQALLGVTDKRRERANNKLLIKTYDKLRPQAVQHVRDSIPNVARLLETHASLQISTPQ
ncbi:MAG: hypothetical protein AAGJ35_13690, partial [Myxococcota bacterium]